MRWWLSFADATRPAGSQSLGICIVHAHDEVEAIKAAHAAGINPGGEVRMMDIDEGMAARLSFPLPEWRLLSPAEADALAGRIAAEIDS